MEAQTRHQLLHFKSTPIDKEITHYLLYQAKQILSSDVYKSNLKVTTCKIPFLTRWMN